QLEQPQQFGDGGDLVAFGGDRHLGQTQAVRGCPGADQMQAGGLGARGAAHRLAVNGNVAEGQGATGGGGPRGESLLKGPRVQGGEDAVEGVVAGDTVGQLQTQATQPSLLGDAKGSNTVPGVGPRQQRRQGADQNVAQQVVIAEGRMARVGDVGEV